MRCGVNPDGFLVSSCSYMYHWLLFLLCWQAFITIPIRPSQVRPVFPQSHLTGPSFLLLISPVTIVQVLDFSFCDGLSTVPTPLLLGISIPRFVLGVALLVLAVIPTLKQSVEIYRATKAWQSNKNMRGLTRDGILYFLVYVATFFSSNCMDTNRPQTDRNVIYNTHDIIVNASGPTISATATIYLALFSSIAICTIMPRFIISIRELYNPEARRDWQGIDSGFGLSSQSTGGRMPTAYTEIVQGQSRITEGDEDVTRAMPLQMLNDKTRQV